MQFILIIDVSMLGKNISRWYFELFFFLLENSFEIICMKCQILFSGKNKKKVFSLSSAE